MISTWTQAVVVLAVIVPGFVYQSSRKAVRGPDPEQGDATERILRAVATSAVFASLYLAVLGPVAVDVFKTARTLPDGPGRLISLYALALLASAVLVPWGAARALYYLTTASWWKAMVGWVTDRLGTRRQYNPVPRAWDFAFSTWESGGWVRVLLDDGRWVGGYFASRSYATGWPEPHELFVEIGYVIEDDGTFTGVVSAARGLWIPCANVVLVDFHPMEADIPDPDPASEQPEETSTRGS